ncbi:putative metal-binding integral membrane protein DUF2182 [Yoonia maritima]|uniref:Putative metal-binding integral membrane protein DUF2182 n=1 Tax=Yoonia maritima TaxID=1435347 RepID=A0A2T0W430_9RHOB|nr:DUF2182 domain-containing protein [Yoonia maritima]PRY80173.1 putative metal-binding integral membrane protein DUF2182 [Yoonia maritima]
MSIWAMSTLQLPPPIDIPRMATNWSTQYVLIVVGMWWSMMIAMMLPGAMIHVHSRRFPAGPSTRFFFQYALIWLVFSFAATGLQFALEQLGLFHGMKMWSINGNLSVVFLTAAGVYQFLPMKRTALAKCSSNGNDVSEAMSGWYFGTHCLMASAPLMLLLYVGGAMNIFWIFGLSVVVTIEKWRPRAPAFSNFFGVTCFLMAAYI